MNARFARRLERSQVELIIMSAPTLSAADIGLAPRKPVRPPMATATLAEIAHFDAKAYVALCVRQEERGGN